MTQVIRERYPAVNNAYVGHRPSDDSNLVNAVDHNGHTIADLFWRRNEEHGGRVWRLVDDNGVIQTHGNNNVDLSF